MTRAWAMPSPDTFTIKPIRAFVDRWLTGRTTIVDPFARNSGYAPEWSNDLNPKTGAKFHLEARAFLRKCICRCVKADAIILDWPYSPTQAKRCYEEAGVKFTREDAQDAAMKKEVRALVTSLADPGAVALVFGWNTTSMGDGWELREVLICDHGASHNATLCAAWVKL